LKKSNVICIDEGVIKVVCLKNLLSYLYAIRDVVFQQFFWGGILL